MRDDGEHRVRRCRHRARLPRPALAVRRTVGGLHRDAGAHPADAGRGGRHHRRHGSLLADHFGEDKGMRDIRKHVAWYLHGFPPAPTYAGLWPWSRRWTSLDALLSQLDRDVPFPAAASGPRGRQGSPAAVSLPDGWLIDPTTARSRPARCHALGRLNRDDLDIGPRVALVR